MSFGIWELGIIMVIVTLLFGTKKLGSIGGDIGNAIKGFRNAIKDDESTARNSPRTAKSLKVKWRAARKVNRPNPDRAGLMSHV